MTKLKLLASLAAAAAVLAFATPAAACEGYKTQSAQKKTTTSATVAARDTRASQPQQRPAAVSQKTQPQSPKAATN